jgi:hypothetical protein
MFYNNWPIKIAEPEKSLLDFFYLNPDQTDTHQGIESLRLNISAIRETVDFDKLHMYLTAYECLRLNKRIRKLIEVLNA